MMMRLRFVFAVLLCAGLSIFVRAQGSASPAGPILPKNPPPPRSDTADKNSNEPSSKATQAQEPGQTSPPVEGNPDSSSSRKFIIDLTPPSTEASETSKGAPSKDSTGVGELHPWNPHRADKDIEVGDYYLHEKNYAGAEARYRDALEYKPGDAVATYRLAAILEKTKRSCAARKYYESYLKILPYGPYADDSKKALLRIPVSNSPCLEQPAK